MGRLAFWKTVVQDKSNFLERIIALLEDNGIRYCVIGGVAVNAYADAVLTEDLDVVIAIEQLDEAARLAALEFKVREFPYSINVYDPGSRLQVQFQRRPEMSAFLEHAEVFDVLGLQLPVASPKDLLGAKVDAAMEPTRRGSKRQKDLADISRLLERFPELRDDVPAEIIERLYP